ncbi:hypothetical protein GY50_0499 [Dehalococcoides mccartyi GY50]|nr:hypothetical protein GY50_0499 [Dehalococcoides mccartyi GY50]
MCLNKNPYSEDNISGQGLLLEINGGGGGIRTHGSLSGTTVFKTVTIDRSDTPP